MRHSCCPTLFITALALLLGGCASPPQVEKVTQIYVCAAQECGPAGQNHNATQMLRAVYRLLKQNEGKDFKVCSSDPKTRHCASEGVSYYVQGGPFPGMGRQASGKMEDIQLDLTSQTVSANMSSELRFWGIPLACAPHTSTVSVRSVDEITLVDAPYYCNWVGVGNMSATFSLAVESVDFDKGLIGGYWSHSVAGTAVGKGSGYAVLQFAEPMPGRENWLKAAE